MIWDDMSYNSSRANKDSLIEKLCTESEETDTTLACLDILQKLEQQKKFGEYDDATF